MSIFQSYIDNIKAKTGKTPEDFKQIAEKKGFLSNGEIIVKAGEIVQWLKTDFELGHGHAMAIYAVFKQAKQTIVVNGETRFTDKKAVKKPEKTSKTKKTTGK